MASYQGPLRDEPLAVELFNTVFAADGEVVDGLATADSARAWLRALGDRLPAGGTGDGTPAPGDLVALRVAVRDAVAAVAAGEAPGRGAVDTINAFSARAPRYPVVAREGGAVGPSLSAGVEWAGRPARGDVVLAALAASAIEVVTGGTEVRLCGAPSCVLAFTRDHPRREWCSPACGNRARQARHYRRTRGRPA